MGTPTRVFAGLVVLLAIAGGVQAQGDLAAPTVEIEDISFDDPVVPEGQTGQAEFDLAVGCDAVETPETITLVLLQPEGAPDWAQLTVSPPVLQWQTEVGDCPSAQAPFSATVQAFASVEAEAPAYEQTSFSLAATVEKIPPTGDDNRSYGPFEADVSLTAGYLHDETVSLETDTVQVLPNETASFEGQLVNDGNGEAAYTLSHDAGDNAEVTVEPTEHTLGPGEEGAFTVDVALADPQAETSENVTVELTVDGRPTHPAGGEGGSEDVALQVSFQAPPSQAEGEDGVPMPGLLVSLMAALVATALRSRTRS